MTELRQELARADAMLDMKRYDQACGVLARLVAAEPENARAWCLLARAHAGQGDYQAAAQAANRAVTLVPSDDWPHRLASNALLADNSVMTHPVLARELTRTVAITALHTFPNTAMTAPYQPGPGWVPPATVRRALDFMQAHASQPLTLEQVAAAAGVTGRALQYAFRRYYGTTPIGYLRRIRLERADADLRAADPDGGVQVGSVAGKWGWASPSQFSLAYHERFGVRPSHTLKNR